MYFSVEFFATFKSKFSPMKKSLLFFLFFFCCHPAVAQAPASVDQAFGAYPGFNNIVGKIVAQPDGKILVCGTFTQYKGKPCKYLTRLLPDGSIDPDFDLGTGFNNLVGTILLQPDGKIIVTGLFQSFNSLPSYKMLRLNPDGTKDVTFIPQHPADGGISALAIQPDNKIIIGGTFTSFGPFPCNKIARLNPDGSVDTSYNTGGGFADGWPFDIAVQPDGKCVFVGNFTQYDGYTRNRIIRLNADGAVDSTFAIGTGFGTPGSSIAIRNVLAQSDGKIIVTGGVQDYKSQPEPGLIRLLDDGSKDTSFNVGTGLTSGTIEDALLDADGKLLLAGSIGSYNGTPIGKNCIRVNTDGSLDATLSPQYTGSTNTVATQADGKILLGGQDYIARLEYDGALDPSFDFGKGISNYLGTSLLMPDGKIIVGDIWRYNMAYETGLIKLNPDGTKDPAFNTSGLTSEGTDELFLLPDGKILAYGYFTFSDGYGIYGLVRFNPDGSRDTSFNCGFTNGSQVQAIALQPDGKIIVFGANLAIPPSTYYNGMLRLNADGSLDSMFPLSNAFGISHVSAISVQPDGKIFVGGDFTQVSGQQYLRIVRLMPNGTIDPSFNPGEGFNGQPQQFLIQPDGKILAVGYFTSYNMIPAKRIVRINPDGSIDPTFNNNLLNAAFYCAALQADGKILAGGSKTAEMKSLVRFNSDGTLDPNFDVGTDFTYTDTNSGEVHSIQLQADGKIFVEGDFYTYNGVASANLIRLTGGNELSTIDLTRDKIVAYPNPVRDLLYLNIPDGINATGYEIWDLTGKKVAQYSNMTPAIDVRSLSLGTYIVKVKGQDAVYNIRFIKE